MERIIVILVAAILSENFVLSKFLGICPFLGVSKKLNSAFGMSCAVIFGTIESSDGDKGVDAGTCDLRRGGPPSHHGI